MRKNEYTLPGMIKQIEQILGEVGQTLRLHAGGIELVDFTPETGLVRVRLVGACQGCALAEITLKRGVESALCQAIPEVKQVIAV